MAKNRSKDKHKLTRYHLSAAGTDLVHPAWLHHRCPRGVVATGSPFLVMI